VAGAEGSGVQVAHHLAADGCGEDPDYLLVTGLCRKEEREKDVRASPQPHQRTG